MKFCKDCKHYSCNGHDAPKCLASWKGGGGKVELVHGTPLFSQTDKCSYQRNNGEWRCGEEGKYFEQKEEVKVDFNIKFKEDDQ